MDIAGIDEQCTLTKYVDTSKEQIKIKKDAEVFTTNGGAEVEGNASGKLKISTENQPQIITQGESEKVSSARSSKM